VYIEHKRSRPLLLLAPKKRKLEPQKILLLTASGFFVCASFVSLCYGLWLWANVTSASAPSKLAEAPYQAFGAIGRGPFDDDSSLAPRRFGTGAVAVGHTPTSLTPVVLKYFDGDAAKIRPLLSKRLTSSVVPIAIGFYHKISSETPPATAFAHSLHGPAMLALGKPPTLHNEVRTLALKSQSLDPVEIAANASPADPNISSWLVEWKHEIAAGQDASVDDEFKLKSLLRKTSLSAADLFHIGGVFRRPLDEARIAMSFCAAGVVKTHDELATLVSGSARVRPLLETMSAASPQLMDMVEQSADDSFDPATTMNEDLVKWISPYDLGLADQRRQAQLWLAMLDVNSPTRMLASLNKLKLDDGSYLSLVSHYVRARALFQLGRYKEASEQLSICVAVHGFGSRAHSCQLLALCLAWSGDMDGAKRTASEWISDYGPSISAQLETLDLAEGRAPARGDFGMLSY
jgi:hypothetical protein